MVLRRNGQYHTRSGAKSQCRNGSAANEHSYISSSSLGVRDGITPFVIASRVIFRVAVHPRIDARHEGITKAGPCGATCCEGGAARASLDTAATELVASWFDSSEHRSRVEWIVAFDYRYHTLHRITRALESLRRRNQRRLRLHLKSPLWYEEGGHRACLRRRHRRHEDSYHKYPALTKFRV